MPVFSSNSGVGVQNIVQNLRTNIPRQAINEAGSANLPGKDGGPYDAYRHILWTAEMTRRYGEPVARAMAQYHEWEGNEAGQTADRRLMDEHNNELGFDIGRQARSWDEVVERAREMVDQSASTGGNGPASWLPQSDWRHSDVDLNPAPRDPAGNPLPPSQWNWPSPAWPISPFPLPASIPAPPSGNATDVPVNGTWEAEGWGGIDPYGVNIPFHTASRTRPPAPRDPLAIDLDGDGIETVGSAVNPVLFDHNADGIRTGTGWVRPDDAWLVLDRDGNGLIDSGRELFGVDTVLSGTPGVDAVYASTGFQALAALDGNFDNVFDASDAAFTQVRLWRDLNQDGISQSTELFTLAQHNIVSISLNASTTNINLGNGNTVSGTAVVTRVNGSTTQAGSVNVTSDTTAANLNLTSNPFYREFTTPVAPSTAAVSLPEMGGSGWVRDLREAMSLGTPQGNALAAQVQAFAAATTRDAQMALLDNVLRLWAETNQVQAMGPADDPSRRFVLNGNAGTSAQLQWAVPILEVFNGMGVNDAGMQAPTTSTGGSGQTVLTYSLFANQAPVMLAAYEALRSSVYSALVTQTRLAPYLDAIELVIDENGVRLNASAMGALLDSRRATDERNALADLVDLNRYEQSTLQTVGFDGLARLRTWIDALPANSPIRAELAQLGIELGASAVGTPRNDIYLGDAGANFFSAGTGDDIVAGFAGNDTLVGGTGNDVLDGGAGNDLLIGGNDSGGAWNGSNYYTGAGNDTYRFGRGDGQDTIWDVDATAGNVDTISLKEGVAPTDVRITRPAGSNNLILSIVGTTDTVTVVNFFAGDGTGGYAIEQMSFADGTVWDLAAIKARALLSTAGADDITGYATDDTVSAGDGNDRVWARSGNDTVQGGAGNDTLWGEDGNDSLQGQDGNDTLVGGTGNDVLDGGAGNDLLIGGNDSGGAWNGSNYYTGAGNDTYRFGRGDGQDTIWDVDATAGNVDVLSLGTGIGTDQLWFRRVGANLEVSIIGTTDKATIANWYSGAAYHVEQILTADGRLLLNSKVDALVSAMAAFAPPAAGQTTLPTDYQAALGGVIAANWTPPPGP